MNASANIVIRLSPQDKSALKKAAKAAHLSLSQFIRNALNLPALSPPPPPTSNLCPKCAPHGHPLPLCRSCNPSTSDASTGFSPQPQA